MNDTTILKIIKVIREDKVSNNDLYSIISYLFRIFIDNSVKDNITKYIDNKDYITKK